MKRKLYRYNKERYMTTQRKIDLIAKIDELIEASRADLAADTIKLVDIKSVMGVPLPGAPFGEVRSKF